MNNRQYHTYLLKRQEELSYDVVQLYKQQDQIGEVVARAIISTNINHKLDNLRDIARGLEYLTDNAERVD